MRVTGPAVILKLHVLRQSALGGLMSLALVRRIVVAGGMLAAACVLGAACETTTFQLPTSRPQCTADVPACVLFQMTLTENGQPVEFVEVPNGSLASPDAGVLSAPGSPPEYTNTPAAMTFTPSADTQSLTLDWNDPTASRPTHVMTLRPHGPTKVQCLAPCCWGCRATHRVSDKLISGSVTYTVTSPVDPLITENLDLVIYPVSSTDPTVDPLSVLLSLPHGGSQSSLLTGKPTISPLTAVAPTSSGSGSGSGGGSCASQCSNGYCGSCGSTSDCCTGAVCISTKVCSVNSVATGCQCAALGSNGTSGVCGDFADNGAPQITACGGVGTASCNTQTSWCCPNLVAVQNGASCTCEDPTSSSYQCPGQ